MFEALWKAGLAEYDDFEGIAWRWQSIDGAMMKAPWHSQALAPIQRIGGKNGSKRHLLVDGRGVPLSLVVTGANRHDVSQWEAVLDALMIKRSLPPQRRSPRLGGGPLTFSRAKSNASRRRACLMAISQRLRMLNHTRFLPSAIRLMTSAGKRSGSKRKSHKHVGVQQDFLDNHSAGPSNNRRISALARVSKSGGM
ncbi:transposase [Acidithiobacillus ferrianus]|uniref:Transposase n=2 Tax=Acidithiobacillus ferrianus TaxID=2678518 RepID=A0A845UPK3_9PROT|nr:transposase [Acidithiobacillus ferrianus]